ncbi:MAG: bifunctional 4-hydroxy-2-oxoglutarate aldolase/2-dehydro-3-deoxy-phosphogluconate aldolase [Ruminococcaceae bacterium]|nr:bifunctional 4-hydroxy-2-oxoglutarate aldolase/2-dehydro-3-deoxy-phosphogluconate aldolase [Oscillospiraceae bacterium]
MKKNIIKAIEENKIIVIVRGVARENLIPLAKAMYDGGIRLIECTFDSTGTVSDEYTGENIRMLAEYFDGKITIGAGTVITEKQVEITKAAGGRFIISPNTNEAVIKKTRELGLVSIPGALTPTEVVAAHTFGADFVKVFPINYMGEKYIKDLKAPLTHIKMLAVGGVTAENIAGFLKSGAEGVGIGSGIVDKKMIEEGRFDEIEALAKSFTEKL